MAIKLEFPDRFWKSRDPKAKDVDLSSRSRHLRTQCECIRRVLYESEITSDRNVEPPADPVQKYSDANPGTRRSDLCELSAN